MSITNHLEYYNEKKALLDELLDSSEELLSSSNELDSFVIILNKRESLIQKLLHLEHLFKAPFASLLTSDQDAELNRLTSLILSLDAHSNERMTDEKNKIAEEIKTNIVEQKLFKYNPDFHSQGGDLLDYKK